MSDPNEPIWDDTSSDLDREPLPRVAAAKAELVDRLHSPIYVNSHFEPGKEYFDSLRIDAADEITSLRTQLASARTALVEFKRWCRTDISRKSWGALHALEDALKEIPK